MRLKGKSQIESFAKKIGFEKLNRWTSVFSINVWKFLGIQDYARRFYLQL